MSFLFCYIEAIQQTTLKKLVAETNEVKKQKPNLTQENKRKCLFIK